MNLNLWNTKDMFSTPTKMGPNKSSSWTSVPSDYNSMSDSQFLFGSQFCPENSQSASVPLEFSIQQRQSKSSQKSSQDNEPSIFAKYQSKPQLFGGDGKEKGSLNFPAGRFKGVLEQFEENKKKIKEKYDKYANTLLRAVNEVLNSFILNIKESLQRLQSSSDRFEETLKSLLDGFGNLSKTLQETSQSHYGLVLNALRDRNEMELALLGMEKRLQDKDTEISGLNSSLQLLKESLNQLTAQQNEQHLKLCEQLGYMKLPSFLAELETFISASRVPNHLKDSATQSSPIVLLTQPYNPHLSVLNISPGSKAISTIQDKENVDTPQRSCILARDHDGDNTLCTCCSSTAVPAGSHEGCWLLTQEPCQATPMRKVIKRDNRVKRLNTIRHSQLNWTHIDSMTMQKHSDDQINGKLATDKKIKSKGRGSRIKKREPNIGNQRKKHYSSRKGGNSSRCTNASVMQNLFRKSEKSQHSYRDTRNPENSSLGPVMASQKNMCWVDNKKAKKSKLVLQPHENKEYVPIPNLQQITGFKKLVDLSSTKNNSRFWVCSSPESSPSPNQMRWFNLFDNHSPACGTSSQQKTTTCCPLLIDSD